MNETIRDFYDSIINFKKRLLTLGCGRHIQEQFNVKERAQLIVPNKMESAFAVIANKSRQQVGLYGDL